MQIKRLHRNIYKLYAYARTQECLDIYRKKYTDQITLWEKLKAEGVSDTLAKEIVGVSRATYYRHKKIMKDLLEKGISPPSKKRKRLNKPKWGESHKQLVLQIRRDNPTYGKEKIAIILKRDHDQTISESTVGRILKHLKSKGLITRSPSALRTKRRRVFKNHAKAWTYKDYKTMVLGERVQIDHMTVVKNGVTVKHFQAWERKSRSLYAEVFSKATALSAKKFLLSFVKQACFPILSIQVDGGSEFMAEFEEGCAELDIPLIVLPPANPEYNGGVERGNRTFREEFYNRGDLLEDSVRGIQAELRQAVIKYNTYRPHRNLKGLTPMEYIRDICSEAAAESH
ncbi:MAG: integrase core domain-containing protein, partial [Alphaproteobacteria bacterium]|nr:integrase core domain-containing protein [Alphaproteobacteria bacterium]